MIRNPKYLSLLIERKRHDWSYLPSGLSGEMHSFLFYGLLTYVISGVSV